MKKFTIKLGQRGEIRITPGNGVRRGGAAGDSGILPVDPDEMEGGTIRRGGQITLYDLAIRMIDGVETPINQRYVYAAYNSTPTLPDVYADLDAELLTGNYLQSRPLDFLDPTPAMPSGIVIVHPDESTDAFTFTEADGWKEKDDGSGYFRAKRSIAGIYTHEADYYADLRLAMDPSVVKITALPDYTADAIPLRALKKSSRVQVYLAPHRPRFRLVYHLHFANPGGPVNSDNIGVGGPYYVELPVIDRWPVRPTTADWINQGTAILDANEAVWAGMYAAREAAALNSRQYRAYLGGANVDDPTIFIGERVGGRILHTQETVYPGTLMGIIVIDGTVHYIWSSAFDNKGEFHLGSTILPRVTSWGVVPDDGSESV